jgi:hypothetical protein
MEDTTDDERQPLTAGNYRSMADDDQRHLTAEDDHPHPTAEIARKRFSAENQGKPDANESPTEIEPHTKKETHPARKILGFPISVFFIVGCEFCERFSYYGMKAILVIYLTNFIGMPANDGTAFTHLFNVVCMSTPLLGAIIADGYWGRYKVSPVISQTLNG